MDKIFEKRIGLFISQSPKYVKCSWPLGKITMYRDNLVINAITEKFILNYSDIDFIKKNFLNLEISHHNPDVPESVSLHGLRLNKGIERTIGDYSLDIDIEQ
jgi:hypothetical protein